MFNKIKKSLYYIVLIVFVSILILGYVKKDRIVEIAKNVIYGQLSNNASQTPLSIDSYTTDLMKALRTGNHPKNRKDLVYKFCYVNLNKVTTSEGEEINLGGGIMANEGMKHYQPKKSLFMYHLCNMVSDEFQNSFDDDLLQVVQKTEKASGECDPESDMNGCDFSIMLPGLFNGLMNDYSNIKLMGLFGYSDEQIDESIKKFSDTYFGKGLCGDNIYLNKESIDESKYSFCSHPKTYRLLYDYVKSVQELKNTKFIDFEKLIGNENNYLNIGLIDLSAEMAFKHWDDFKDILYNELTYYNLFIVFYGNQISSNTNYSKFAVTSDIGSHIDESKMEYSLLIQEINLSQQAVFQMDRLMGELYTTFPMHIGLMAYYEDVLNFRAEFAKIYTPMHQLYYKLQNVQDLRR